jgi:hypothetical protein
MLSITNHQGNANQRHNELLLHSSKNGHYQRQKVKSSAKNMEKTKGLHKVDRSVN